MLHKNAVWADVTAHNRNYQHASSAVYQMVASTGTKVLGG